MEDLKEVVSINIIIAEGLNMEKQKAVNKLEARLNTCPSQWLQQTKRFINIIINNISERDKLILKLRSLKHNYFYKDEEINNTDVEAITADLQQLDSKDTLACDIYLSVMNEEF